MAGWGKCRRCQGRIYWGTSPYNAAKAFPFDDDQEQQSHFATCSAQEWVTDAAGARHQSGACKACKARVWWDTTHTGRRRPMDIEGDVAILTCHLDTCVGVPRATTTRGEDYDAAWARALPGNTGATGELWAAELGLDWPCTLREATTAFRRRALVCHPDMGGDVADFVRIRLAFDRLKELLKEEVTV